MKKYLDLVGDVLVNGSYREERTGTGAYSVFGRQVRYNLDEGFPLLTTKKVHLKSIIHELLWFCSGSTDVKYLKDNNVTIWDSWVKPDGTIGPGYSEQWRSWKDYKGGSIDQLKNVIDSIRQTPNSRRHIVSSWNVADLPDMALPPCHCFFQFFVNGGRLDLQLYQRSADLMLGVPFNVASYALLLMMVAQVTGLRPGEFIHTFGDLHVYKNHINGAREQIKRKPEHLPTMKLNPDVTDIFKFKYEDFTLENYNPHPSIKFEVAV